jgi:hypothetical protein
MRLRIINLHSHYIATCVFGVKVNKNYLSALHVDKNNLGPSYIVGHFRHFNADFPHFTAISTPIQRQFNANLGVGDYTDGGLWVQDMGEVGCKHSWEQFDGNVPHCTLPYEGKCDQV